MSPFISQAAAPGTVLAGRFCLDERLASGGMGEVWRGTDLDAEPTGIRQVAIKVLAPELRSQRVFLDRLAAEAVNLGSLNHPSLARFIAHGHSGTIDYLAMEYVPGVPLHVLAAGGASEDMPAGSTPNAEVGGLTYRRIAAILAHVAAALAHAHERGVVHRDVKPANILVKPDPTGDQVWVTDFGIAFGRGASDLTEPGRVMGTAEYLAPERVKGGPSSPATDLYALGVTAFEVITGYRPYDGPSPVAIAMKHILEPPPPLPIRVPPRLARLVSALLAKDPVKRPRTAAQVSREFANCAHIPSPTPPEPPAPPAPEAL
ncbi:hypothetical protein BSZ39_04735 [Bowdeniella nasicola]|uniref:non-specific serine/threonine protein kinase n=1 Tax=Bowdeniella nasicola TaxID=208480 RepID=A0A1Q5Q3R8_9ACTO|nr:serine/threonine-protein kinase [Bowdeniella nasicola]OKL54339.1 hypothetical protein BSZ39_04735 [Bowdeniella nasicola]